MPARISHPEFDALTGVRTSIERNDSKNMITLILENDVSRVLKNLNVMPDGRADGATRKAPDLRVNELLFRRVVDVGLDVPLLLSGPSLVRNLVIRRVHDPAGLGWTRPAIRASRSVVSDRRSKYRIDHGSPHSLHFRLSIGQARRIPGGGGGFRRQGLPRGGRRHQEAAQEDEPADCAKAANSRTHLLLPSLALLARLPSARSNRSPRRSRSARIRRMEISFLFTPNFLP
jgi:hypothetical protein